MSAVTTLPEIWTWSDFFRLTDELGRQGKTYDRLIILGHGGFDGPLLTSTSLAESSLSQGVLTKVTASQPGVKMRLTVAYSETAYPRFAGFIQANWQELVQPSVDALETLMEQYPAELASDEACFLECRSTGYQQIFGRCDTPCQKTCRGVVSN